jgi:hypothetical protein
VCWRSSRHRFRGSPHIGRCTAEDGSTDVMSVQRVMTIPAADRPPQQLRLMLKPEIGPRVSATGFVDGAWWPRSRDLAAEAPALAKALAACLGSVERISYNLAAWGPTIRQLRVDGAALRLAGYRSQHADTVDVLGRTHRITLLVVPPEATEAAGHQALVLTSAANTTDDPTQLLLLSGVRSSPPTADAPHTSGDAALSIGVTGPLELRYPEG